jgi:long-chain acyl-CoA synthetase
MYVRGEAVSAGYWEGGGFRPSPRDSGDWLRTGDIGERDAEGNLRFKGRKKNVIVTPSGMNVYPEDIEMTLRKQDAVRDCVVLPLEQSGNGEPYAVLLMRDGSAGDAGAASAAIEAANARLAEYQRVRHWTLWPEADFPRTPTGKPKLSVIFAQATEALRGLPDAKKQSGALDDVLAKFNRAGTASGKMEKDLKLTSLDRVELMSALEERFQLELNETAFAEAKTVADVEQLLRHPGARKTEFVYPRWTQRAPVRWFRQAVYYALVWPATKILGHPKILGRENLRGVRGPVLVVSNHITRRADIGLILLALPLRFRHRMAIAMGGESVQRMQRPPREWFFLRRLGYWMGYWLVTALFNVFPLPQHSGYRESFRFAGESVDRGCSLLIFPEGEVNNSDDGKMAPFQSGIGLLAENLRLPIIPMRLDGVWKMKREHRRLAHFGEIVVHIGAPMEFPPDAAPEAIARSLEARVAEL